MSNLQQIQQRLSEAAKPDERFALTITERFVYNGFSGHKGKAPEVYITRWSFVPHREDAQGIAHATTVDEAMRQFEVWLAGRKEVAA